MTHRISTFIFTLFTWSVVLIGLGPSVPVQAQVDLDRVQVVYTSDPVEIPADRDGSFRLFFPYINPTGVDMENVVAELRIQGNGFVFVPSEVVDYYNPISGDVVDCTNLENVPAHPVEVPLASSASVLYGLQSATDVENPGGDTVGRLISGQSGCIQVTMAVDTSIIVGQKAQVFMNWYPQEETDNNKLPPVGVYELEAVQGRNRVEECRADEELLDGVCVKVCRLGQIRDISGICVDQSTLNSQTIVAVTTNTILVEPEFNFVMWILGILLTTLAVSLVVLLYSIVNYIQLRR